MHTPIRIFISSVQNEFATERRMLYDYLSKDALLGRYFEPFIFEELPANNTDARTAYLSQEFDIATKRGIYRLAFI